MTWSIRTLNTLQTAFVPSPRQKTTLFLRNQMELSDKIPICSFSLDCHPRSWKLMKIPLCKLGMTFSRCPEHTFRGRKESRAREGQTASWFSHGLSASWRDPKRCRLPFLKRDQGYSRGSFELLHIWGVREGPAYLSLFRKE